MEKESSHQKYKKEKTRAPYEDGRNGGKRNIKKRNRKPDRRSAQKAHEESKGSLIAPPHLPTPIFPRLPTPSPTAPPYPETPEQP